MRYIDMKKNILLFFMLTLPLSAQVKESNFIMGSFKLTDDKAAHFLAGMVVYGAVERITPPDEILRGALCFTVALGKEFIDSRGDGKGNIADFAYTVAGSLTARILIKKVLSPIGGWSKRKIFKRK